MPNGYLPVADIANLRLGCVEWKYYYFSLFFSFVVFLLGEYINLWSPVVIRNMDIYPAIYLVFLSSSYDFLVNQSPGL